MQDKHALILTEVRNRVGHLTLNRVSAFNAINLEMVRSISNNWSNGLLMNRWLPW